MGMKGYEETSDRWQYGRSCRQTQALPFPKLTVSALASRIVTTHLSKVSCTSTVVAGHVT
jgi:hypothetical protein